MSIETSGPVSMRAHPLTALPVLDAFDRFVARVSSARFARLPVTLLMVFALLAANFILTLLDPRPPGADDREQLAHATHWALGYSGVQPPLHTWLVLSLESLMGDGVHAVFAARFLVLACTFAALAGLSHALGLRADALAAGTFGAFLLPQIGWESQRTFSHSLSALLFSTIVITLLVVIARRSTARLWIALGLAAGAAILSKYNSALIIACGSAALLLDPIARRQIRARHAALGIAAMAALLSAPLVWLSFHLRTLDDSAHKFEFAATGALSTLGLGLSSFLSAVLAYCALLLFICGLALLASTSQLGPASTALRRVSLSRQARLVAVTIGLSLGAMLLLVLASGATEFKVYWLHPALVLTAPLAAFILARADPTGRANRFVTGAAMLAALATTIAFTLRIFGIG